MFLQAMVAARKKISSLQEQVDTTVSFLDQEKEATQNALELFSKALLVIILVMYSCCSVAL